MKKHRPARIIALLMALVLTFAACAGPQAPTDAPTAAPTSGQTETQAPEPTASSAPEQTDAPTQTEPASQESSQTEEAGLPELAALTATLGEATASFTAPDDAFDGTVIEAFYHPGGLIPTLEPVDAEGLTEEGAATIDRAMRAYTSTGTEDLIIQAADSFWLYDHLTEHQQTIYDAIYVLAMDPVTPDYYVSFQTTVNPGTDQMMIDFLLAWLCIGDDHPELWWAYYWNGTTSLNLQYNTTPQNGRYTCYLSFTEPYTTFEEDVTAFNAAVEEFLSDIDPDADEAAKALQVHDKLIEWGIYDMDILQNNKLDFGHTAFGPFVGNSSGTPHYCVCDGYAHAYQYALQQLGMEALVVCGMAGDAGADGGQGGHAWSMVDIDGRWYEVDACWDDHTDTLDEVKAAYAPSSAEYRYYTEMLTDKNFMDRVNHFMYRLMTAEINNYTAPDSLTYTTKDGKYRLRLVGDSQRTRYAEYADAKDTVQGLESALFPIADGRLIDGGGGTEPNPGKTEEPTNPTNQTGPYAAIAGSYIVTSYNGFDQRALSQYYGANYYESLSQFDLNADGTGVLRENGASFPFTFIYDGYTLYMYAANGGGLLLFYLNGSFVWYDYYGNVYGFTRR